MSELNDHELLAQYARTKSESAFAGLVGRHVNLVYSAALRFSGNRHDAQEITQAVFIILARKAESLRPGTILSGWLYQTARLTAANFVRGEIRRQRREEEACMQSTLNEPNSSAWELLAPCLDQAMHQLGQVDHDAIVLRFFENKPTAEVAAALKLKEPATHKRVNRALEKLRKILLGRGVTLSAAAIATAVAANSVHAAPPGAIAAIQSFSIAATKGAALAGSASSLVNGTLQAMLWAKCRSLLGWCAISVILGGAIVAPFATNHSPRQLPPVTPPSTAASTTTRHEAAREPLTSTAYIALTAPLGGVVVQSDGKIVIGTHLSGFFVDPETLRLGLWKRGAARLLPDGSLDREFFSQVDGDASDAHRAHVMLQSDGRLVMSGLFETLDGKSFPGYARLLPDGRVDESFIPWHGSTNQPKRTYLPGGTYPAATLRDGAIAVMSDAIEGPRAPYPLTVYRLASSGELLPQLRDNLSVPTISRPSGLILTLGSVGFWARKPIDWTRTLPSARRKFYFPPGQEPPVADLPFEACTEAPSATDAAPVFKALFDEVPLELCRYAVQLSEGATLLAIRDKAIDGSMLAPGRLMRFDKNWAPDFSFTNHYDADLRSCMTVKQQQDGKFLVAGLIGKMNGEDFPGLVRVNEDGSVDRSFHCQTDGSWQGRVMDFAVQSDGRIVICGFFNTVNGAKCPHLARLNPDGSLDETFKSAFVSLEKLNSIRFPVHQLAENPETPTSSTTPVSVAPQETILITSLASQETGATIQFNGKPSATYILQAKDAAEATNWTNVSTNQANPSGNGTFHDPDATNHPLRFYRIATSAESKSN